MNTIEAIFARRSVRKFTDEPVSDEQIQTLLECAMAAPSACNKRPWLFYVVKNPETLEKLRGTTRYTNMVSPLNIIVAGDEKRGMLRKACDFWTQDCAAAVENILLAAAELGLGACWCGLFPLVTPVKRIREWLELEQTTIPMALIHIGYPAENPAPRTQYDAKRVKTIL